MRIKHEAVDVLRPDRVHALDEVGNVGPAAAVAARLQQVAAHGHRRQAQRRRVGEIARLDAAGERDRKRSPKARRKRATSAMASGCSGGPDRYISGSLAGKKRLWFSTTSVLENFTPKLRPRAAGEGAEALDEADDVVPGGVLGEGASGTLISM